MSINKTRQLFTIIVIIILLSTGSMLFSILNPEVQNVKAASVWTQNTDQDFSNGTMINATILGTGFNAELSINLTEIHEWSQKSPSSYPSARGDHAAAAVYGTRKIILFGGNDGSYDDETWVYDLNDHTWTDKTPSPRPSSYPSARIMHAMASIYGDDKVLLFGGWDSYYDDETWVYDLSDDKWTQKQTAPFDRRLHAMASIYGDDKVLVFGGYRSGAKSDTWVYDLSDDSWTQKSSGPSARYEHAMASVYNDDKIVLFGGTSGSDETWVYDLNLNSWTRKYPTTRPNGRYNHAMATIHGTDEILLYGGSSSSDETWLYDLNDGAEGTWTQKFPSIDPWSRVGHTMAGVYGIDKVLFFGGGWSSLYSDTWVYSYSLPTKNGTYISAPYDTGSKSEFNSITWNGNVPAETSLKFQLRTSTSESGLKSKPFVGPNGKSSTYYINTAESLWTGHNGDRWVQVKVYLNISIITTSPTVKEISIHYNCLPNTTAVSPTDESVIAKNKPIFIWSFSDVDSADQAAFQVIIDDESDFQSIDFDSTQQDSTNHQWQFPDGTSYTTIPDGTWYWKVRTKDEDGAWSEYSPPFKLIIDPRAPTSATTIPINNGYYKDLNVIMGMASDGPKGSGVKQVEIIIKRLSDNYYWDGNTWFPLESWLLATGTTTWAYDSSAVDWLSGERYVVRTQATDFANNVENPAVGNVFDMDMECPISTIENPVNNSWVNKLDTVSGTCMEVGNSGIEKVQICIKRTSDNKYWDGSDWKHYDTWLNASNIEPWHIDTRNIQWITGAEYIIHSRAIDNAGNIESPVTKSIFNFDDQPPEPLSIKINDDDEFTNSPEVRLTLSAKDIGSGVSEMTFSKDGSLWSYWEQYDTTKLYNLTTGDSQKFVYFRVRDLAGNLAEPVSDIITLDTTPPEVLSFIINNNDEFTNTNIVTLNLDVIDTLSGVDTMSFSTDGETWSTEEIFSTSKFLMLPSNDGEQIVQFKVKDKAGNAALETNNITLDTTPPHSLSIIINNGASKTSSRIVTLELNALDDESGVSWISFSLDGNTWSDWEPFTNTKSYTLSSGDGTKTVYFKVKDSAGNVAEPTSTKIALKPSSSDISSIFGDTSIIALLFIIIALVILIIVLVLFGWLKKRKKSQESGYGRYDPGGYETSASIIPLQPEPYQPRTVSTPVSLQTQPQRLSTTQVPGSTGTPQQLIRPSTGPTITQQKRPGITPEVKVPTQQPQTEVISKPGASLIAGSPPKPDQTLTSNIQDPTRVPQLPPGKNQN